MITVYLEKTVAKVQEIPNMTKILTIIYTNFARHSRVRILRDEAAEPIVLLNHMDIRHSDSQHWPTHRGTSVKEDTRHLITINLPFLM